MEEQRNRRLVMNTFHLKLLAIFSMTIDHTGAVLFPEQEWMRIIGRLAFPIYCYLLVIGFEKTRNVWKYVLRLVLFACISEVFFNLAFFDAVYYPGYQNVFFTLFLGLLMLICMQQAVLLPVARKEGMKILLRSMTLIGFCLLAYEMKTDYSLFGILMIFIFYEYRNLSALVIWQTILNVFFMGGIQGFALCSLVPIAMYNGKKGTYSLKWFFYAYYPLHLFVIYLIHRYVGGTQG